MNTKQRIYTLLAKTEKQKFKADNAKASRKMAFALADDLVAAEELLARSTSEVDGYVALLQNAVSVVEDLQNQLEQALENYNLEDFVEEADKLLQEFNDNAFELGINPEQSTAYRNLKDTLARSTESVFAFVEALREARQYLNI